MPLSKRLLVLPILTSILLGFAAIIYLFGDYAEADDKFAGQQWKLPKYLSEASGLALIQDRELLIHNDEEGLIYSVDVDTMVTRLVASLGSPTIRSDFEGIAIANGDVYLSTSMGLLYRAQNLSLVKNDQHIEPQIIDTGLGKTCEMEGLVYLEGLLLLPCKTAYVAEHKEKLLVFAYSLAERTTQIIIEIPTADLEGLKKVQPTAIDIDREHYYILSGHRLIVIDRELTTTRVYALPKKRHTKPEGIAVLSDGGLVIVDDNKKGKSRLTYYKGLHALKEKREKL
ncbi:MAG: hypothetical protein ACI9GW_003677 [Halieaceae bacterium]|jgi:hypothetical protein